MGPDGSVRYPDFTVDDAESGRRLLIEHLGMLDRPDYAKRWQAKQRWYESAGVRNVEHGPADVRLLTTTEEDGFDAAAVKVKLISALEL
jgi:hypothetical protein